MLRESRGYCFFLWLASLPTTLYYLSTPLEALMRAPYIRNIIQNTKIEFIVIKGLFMITLIAVEDMESFRLR
jgi:hypothetical protein